MILLHFFRLIIIVVAIVFVRHQNRLKQRAYLMQEAMRNRDFTFRLTTRGMMWGERAMQEALNSMGQELKKQMAENEVESWQRLTRVLTYEIMNAITPISSISQAFLGRADVKGSQIEEGIRAIHDTSVRLHAFVENYRKLTQLQASKPQLIQIRPFALSIASLYPNVDWHIEASDSDEAWADEGLLRQVMINLTKNAIEAGARRISVRIAPLPSPPLRGREKNDSLMTILFSNDGKPILPEVRREIFVPFFTTKASGSGIGLSQSRQIMIRQGGNLTLADTPGSGYNVTFEVEMPLKSYTT